MEKEQKKNIEKLFSRIAEIRDEAESIQSDLDEIKDSIENEESEDYISVYNAANNLDTVITGLENANEQLLDVK